MHLSDKINIERGLISKILEEGITVVKDKQIKPLYLDKINKPILTYLYDYYNKNGSVPTIRVFQQKFPNFKLETYTGADLIETVGTEEPMTYWCNEVRNKAKHNKIVDVVDNVATKLEDFETEEAYKYLKKAISYIESSLVESQAIIITDDAEDRKATYLKRKENKGMIGISMGIDRLDFMLKGMQPKQLITLIANTGIGKANPLDTPVLTPNGFIPMRDIKVGSKVIGEDGKPYPVTAIHPQGIKDIYEVTFNDGTKSRCCKEHLWKFKTTDDRMRNKNWRVDTLENIMKLPLKRGRGLNLVIPVNKPVEFEPISDLPINPYVLGTLLGDGGFTTDRITLSNPEGDVIMKCNYLLRDWGEFTYHKGTNCQFAFKSNDKKINKLYRTITSLGLKHHKSEDKFIPINYLFSSIEDRRELLRGLFDTDGHVNNKGNYSISTYSIPLKDNIMFLCRSLGYRCTSSVYDRTKESKGVEYRINIATNDIIFGTIKHKFRYDNRIIPKKEHDYSIQKIVSIEKVGEYECQCISVDSEDHTYLVDDFIVTHNTWFLLLVCAYCILNGYRPIFFTTEMSEEQIEDRLEAILLALIYGEDFNYGRFKSGSLTPEEQKMYFDFLEMKHTLEPCVIETATSPSGVRAKIEQYKADIVFIDSAYLMQDDQGADSDWLRIAHITRDLKGVAKDTKLTIFINTQADKNTSKKTGPELENINFSQSVGQDSDVVMALFRDLDMIEDNEMKVKVLKQREGTLGSVMLNWNFERMCFSPIYSSVDNQMNTTPKDKEITKKGKHIEL